MLEEEGMPSPLLPLHPNWPNDEVVDTSKHKDSGERLSSCNCFLQGYMCHNVVFQYSCSSTLTWYSPSPLKHVVDQYKHTVSVVCTVQHVHACYITDIHSITCWIQGDVLKVSNGPPRGLQEHFNVTWSWLTTRPQRPCRPIRWWTAPPTWCSYMTKHCWWIGVYNVNTERTIHVDIAGLQRFMIQT